MRSEVVAEEGNGWYERWGVFHCVNDTDKWLGSVNVHEGFVRAEYLEKKRTDAYIQLEGISGGHKQVIRLYADRASAGPSSDLLNTTYPGDWSD